MISETQILYGSRVARHGNALRFAQYQASNCRRNLRTEAGPLRLVAVRMRVANDLNGSDRNFGELLFAFYPATPMNAQKYPSLYADFTPGYVFGTAVVVFCRIVTFEAIIMFCHSEQIANLSSKIHELLR